MVAILAGIKLIIVFLFKYILRFVAIGFVLVLFVVSAWQSWEQKNPDIFLKEFGGRILMTDKTIEMRMEELKASQDYNIVNNLGVYLLALFDILILFYIIKFIIWIEKLKWGETPPKWSFYFSALVIMFVAEAFFIRTYLGYWQIPFSGFMALATNFIPLLVQPISDFFLGVVPITPINQTANQTFSIWDHIFL